jgi:protein tyrosine phosphatase (PTP) superfamily phosphohydrolase (DUF442 family)
MAIAFNVKPFALPTANNVSLQVTSTEPALTFYVTAQPIYSMAGQQLQIPYAAIARAGIKSVVSVRDPSEILDQTNPFDLTEPGQLIINGAGFANAPLPHYIPSTPTPGAPQQELTQAEFNVQAYAAAMAINSWPQPLLVHCSTGDRASAAFASYLVAYCGYANRAALDFATGKLVLQNAAFKTFVLGFAKP